MFLTRSSGILFLCLCVLLSGCRQSNEGIATSSSATDESQALDPPALIEDRGKVPLVLSEVRITERGGKADWKPNTRQAVEKAIFQPKRFLRKDSANVCKADFKVYYAITSNQQLVDFASFGTGLVGCEAMIHCPRGRAFETFRVELREIESFKDLTPKRLSQLFQRLLDKVTEQAADQLVGQILVRPLSDSKILTVLKGQQTSVGKLMEATIEAGERQLDAALPMLLELTKHSSNVVRLRAAAALGLLKISNNEVIRALARLTEGGNREQIVIAVGALSDIGGQKAMRYLENIAVSHPDEIVRTLARSGTEKIKSVKR